MRWLSLLAALAGATVLVIAAREDHGASADGSAREGRARVARVVDGDTVVLTGVGRSRLIGIDTPEVHGRTECFGREASAFAKRELTGRRVRYTRGVEPTDRYGRALVYLWLDDGRLFNALLVARGYATPLTIPPNVDRADAFVRLSRAARAAQRGLWAPNACSQRAPFTPRGMG